MKQKILCLFLALLTAFTTCSLFSFSTFSEEETSDCVQDGLFAWYKGDRNTRDGQNTGSNTWHDLIGGHDLPVNRDGSNYFTDEGFRVNGQKHYFPDEVLNLVNESYFTIEIEFGDFDPYGQDYNVFMNSSNDSFSLFRRVSENVIEWKYGGGNNRPKIGQSLQTMRSLAFHALAKITETLRGVENVLDMFSIPKSISSITLAQLSATVERGL